MACGLRTEPPCGGAGHGAQRYHWAVSNRRASVSAFCGLAAKAFEPSAAKRVHPITYV